MSNLKILIFKSVTVFIYFYTKNEEFQVLKIETKINL